MPLHCSLLLLPPLPVVRADPAPFFGDRHFHTKYVITSSQRQESEQAVWSRLLQLLLEKQVDLKYFFQDIIPCLRT